MATKTLSAVRAIIRQFLNDELQADVAQDFQDDEIDLHIQHTLEEISERRPYEFKEKLTTTASSKELNISSIEDFLGLDGEHEIEYPIGSEPPNYHNASIFGNTLRMIVDRVPGADEDVYLYCHKVHQLTEESSTLSPQIEKLLVDGTVAYVALSWINQIRKQTAEAISRIADVNTTIGSMSGRITAAVDDLEDGRLLINKINIGGKPQLDYAAYASRELGNANSYLSQSQGYLRELTSRLSISGAINAYQTWANNKLVLYRADLRRLARARTYTEYPKG